MGHLVALDIIFLILGGPDDGRGAVPVETDPDRFKGPRR